MNVSHPSTGDASLMALAHQQMSANHSSSNHHPSESVHLSGLPTSKGHDETINLNINLDSIDTPFTSAPSVHQQTTSPLPEITLKPTSYSHFIDVDNLSREGQGPLSAATVSQISAMTDVAPPSPPLPQSTPVQTNPVPPHVRIEQMQNEPHHKHLYIALGIGAGVILIVAIAVILLLKKSKSNKKR